MERIESLCGQFEVWEIEDGGAYVRYGVYDRDSGQDFVARHDDGWRIAPEGHTTVDFERLIGNTTGAFPEYAELDALVATLNLVSGRSI